MSQTSQRLALPLIQPAQAQKHVTHNEAIELLDLIVQLTVAAFDATTPPPSPVEGESWALGASPTGEWANHPGAIANFRGGGWLFVTPQVGWQAYGTGEGEIRVYSGVDWASAGADVASYDNLPGVGVNATSDATNRLSVAADATLFNNDGAGHQLKINKAATGDTASLLFQSAFSGRAEMGLAGTDDFALKVSDGTTWFTGLTVVGASGAVRINEVLSLSPRYGTGH
ncbi:MAG: DUF2793 domain-containing protein [Pseudomonadota bacterium]